MMLLLVPLLLMLARTGRCSNGDRDSQYIDCMIPCYHHCRSHPNFDPFIVYPVQLITLSCPERCNYYCIEKVTQYRQEQGLPLLKYHGHWPFIRLLGIEEPASVVFSILNIAPHMNYLLRRLRLCSTSRKRGVMERSSCTEMSFWLPWYALVGCNCWIASFVYHSKKTAWATNYDLISALCILVFELFMCLRRTIWGNRYIGAKVDVDESQIESTVRSWWSYTSIGTLFAVMLCCCALRAHYMLRGAVSFSSHMQLCIGIVATSTVVWITWVVGGVISSGTNGTVKQHRLGHRWLCLSCQLGMIAASALEIFDFPPLCGLFDAHSLWHLATVPLGFMWYSFWESDNQRSVELFCKGSKNS